MNKEWNEGADAFYDLKGIASCPYPENSEKRRMWIIGHYAAKTYSVGQD